MVQDVDGSSGDHPDFCLVVTKGPPTVHDLRAEIRAEDLRHHGF